MIYHDIDDVSLSYRYINSRILSKILIQPSNVPRIGWSQPWGLGLVCAEVRILSCGRSCWEPPGAWGLNSGNSGNLRQSEATGASFGKCASFVAINGTILDFEKNVTSNVLDLKTCSSEKQRFDVTKFHPNKTSDIKWPIESLEVGLQYNQNFFQTIWKLMESYGAILVGILMEVS